MNFGAPNECMWEQLMTRILSGWPRSHGWIPGRGQAYFSSPHCQALLLGLSILLFNGYWKLFSIEGATKT